MLTCLAIKKKFSMFMFVLYLVLFLLIIELGLETTKQLRLRFRHLLTWNNGDFLSLAYVLISSCNYPHLVKVYLVSPGSESWLFTHPQKFLHPLPHFLVLELISFSLILLSLVFTAVNHMTFLFAIIYSFA